ncbi:hypothetical protein [Bradyrhizobium sp. Arg816]|uniref:hypothetical protein n=1 Tax=Bradyrhizobium sp. Arg816 TaxID=2998491 RepID=UPI00249E792B|nr:hypothetical protein [Bradyrhizobium sp. Arg816]MDI3561291.1 hypothetical protein [Bradyrhizobium sp. Arg816]
MTTIAELRSIETSILLYDTKDRIALRRDQLERWYRKECAVIPRRARLVSELMGGCEASRMPISTEELLPAKARAAAMLQRYGAPLPAAAIELQDTIDLANDYYRCQNELSALERRSSDAGLRPRPAKPVRRDLH